MLIDFSRLVDDEPWVSKCWSAFGCHGVLPHLEAKPAHCVQSMGSKHEQPLNAANMSTIRWKFKGVHPELPLNSWCHRSPWDPLSNSWSTTPSQGRLLSTLNLQDHQPWIAHFFSHPACSGKETGSTSIMRCFKRKTVSEGLTESDKRWPVRFKSDIPKANWKYHDHHDHVWKILEISAGCPMLRVSLFLQAGHHHHSSPALLKGVRKATAFITLHPFCLNSRRSCHSGLGTTVAHIHDHLHGNMKSQGRRPRQHKRCERRSRKPKLWRFNSLKTTGFRRMRE